MFVSASVASSVSSHTRMTCASCNTRLSHVVPAHARTTAHASRSRTHTPSPTDRVSVSRWTVATPHSTLPYIFHTTPTHNTLAPSLACAPITPSLAHIPAAPNPTHAPFLHYAHTPSKNITPLCATPSSPSPSLLSTFSLFVYNSDRPGTLVNFGNVPTLCNGHA